MNPMERKARELGGSPLEDGDDDDAASVVNRPTLSAAALHGVLGDYVRTVAPHTEADPAGILFSLLVGIGALIGRGPHQMLDGSRHGVNLFALLVGPTSAGRKGTAWNQGRELLREVDPDFIRLRVKSGLSSGEGLIDYLTPAEAREGQPPSPPPDPRSLLVETEFAAVLARKRREGNTLDAILRQAFDGEEFLSVMTVKSRQHGERMATGAHVAVLGCITPAELRTLHEGADIRSGFLNRFCVVYVARSRLLPFASQIPREVLRPIAEVLRRAVDYARRTGWVELADEARELWETLYRDLAVTEAGDLGARGAPIVRRIALLFALIEERRSIEVPHLRAAKACWDYCAASAVHVFGEGIGLSTLARRLLVGVREAREGGLTQTEVWKAAGSNNRPREDMARALGELREAGLIIPRIVPTAGRPRTVWVDARLALSEVGGMGAMGTNGDARDRVPPLASHTPHDSLPCDTYCADERGGLVAGY